MPLTRGLTPMKKAFADKMLETDNATEAVRQVWGGQLKQTTGNLGIKAHRLLKDAKIQNYLEQHLHKAKAKVVELIDSKKEDIALKSSIFCIESIEGKATQKLVTEDANGNTLPIGNINVLMARLTQETASPDAPSIDQNAPQA